MKKAIMVMAGLALFAGGASAALDITYYDVENISSSDAIATQAVTVVEGDMIVFAVAGNKKTDTATQTFSASGGGGTFSYMDAATDTGNAATMNAMIGYYTVATGGTYDFLASSSANQTASVSLYHLRADSGLISDVSILNGNRVNNLTAGTVQNLNFIKMADDPNYSNYGDMFGLGVTAMNGSGGTVAISNNVISTWSVDEIDNGQRAIVSADYTGKSTSRWVFDYTTSSGVDDAGNIHMAFAEVIPEPATLGLISVAGLLLYFRRRRL